MNWIETHGFEVLLLAGIVSLVMSAAPSPPSSWGFWKLWAFNAAKAAGANATHFMQQKVPAFEQVSQHAETVNEDGSKTVVDTKAASSPKTQ